MEQITVRFINNGGGGFAESVTCDAGLTIKEFVARKTASLSLDTSSMKITVNDRAVPEDCIVVNDDVVSITPTKVGGGVLHHVCSSS